MTLKGLALASVVLVAGCATVTRGTTSQVQITSEPMGAQVRTSIGHVCTSPCTVTVDRKSEFFVTFSMDGYQEVTVPVRTQVATAGAVGVAGNVIVGGIVGGAVDVATGAGLEHVPNPVHAILQPALSRPAGPRPGVPRR
ncbi:MAG TPA: translation initiation factor 2 [Beijerinckiaceae bacterium]|nr:translation initiation factor 2 [Beijerinckiaceae bacterium]